MDLSSILSTTRTVIESFDDYATSVKDAPKSCESLMAELSSIQEILTELDKLVKVDVSNVYSRQAPLSRTNVSLGFFDQSIKPR